MAPRRKLKPRSARAKAELDMSKVIEELGVPTDDGNSDYTLSPPSATVEDKPWSAGLVSSFTQNADNVADYDLQNIDSAKNAVRNQAAKPLGPPIRRASEVNTYSSTSYKSPNCRSWTAEEEQHLKEVVKECTDAGLSGEALWHAAHPRLLARGVNRPIGGMKMRWCRGLRDETKIDERRKKNNVLLTAVQKNKSERDPAKPKVGRFKGKSHEERTRVTSATTSFDSESSQEAALHTNFLHPLATSHWPEPPMTLFEAKSKAHKRAASY